MSELSDRVLKDRLDDATTGMMNGVRTGRGLVAGVGVLVGLGALFSIGNDLSNKARENHQVYLQQQRQHEKDRYERRYKSSGLGINPAMGNMLPDIWEQRSGHHKMGNAKFLSRQQFPSTIQGLYSDFQ